VSCSGSGVIRVEYAVNAICDPIGLLLTLSAAPPSRVGCRIENASSSTAAAAAAALVPSVSMASVVITCVGPTMADVVASTEVPARAAGVCPALARRHRRLQSRTHQRKDMRHRRRRAVAQHVSPTNEGAASFVQMGRFCRSAATNEWMLWHQVYPCASGPRLLVTRAGAEWQGAVPTVPTWNATSATTPTNRSTTSNLFGKFNSSSSSSGSSSGNTSTTWQAAGVQSFCYNARWLCPPCLAVSATNASCSSASATCSNRVPAVQMTNADARYSCVSAKDDAPSFIIMKQAVEAFSPLLFVDWMAKQLLVAT
jgi:hypothetical protein